MDDSDLQAESISSKIYAIRGQQVMLDRDLAELYGVETGQLNRAMKRNMERFPDNFVFQLSQNESDELSRCQNGILKRGTNTKYLPYAYTEHGVLMLSSVLRTKTAIAVNLKIIDVFISIRRHLASTEVLLTLQEQFKRLEPEQDRLELTQKIDIKILGDKLTHMSRDLQRFSQVLDEFSDAHLIIKRPNEEHLID